MSSWRGVVLFFTDRFPAALYRLRFWWLGCLAANVAVTAVMMWWLLDHPNVEQSLLSPGEVDQLVNNDFEGYYSEYAASHFAAQVWINNAWVTALCLGLGILGLPLVKVLFDNIANLAIIGSIMMRHDRGELFWGLILPHGLLELTAVFVAGGVGFRLFWSWVEPGDLSRSQALAREGRTAGTVALGLVVVLLVSGVIEAFVTPSGLPTWARVGDRGPGRGGRSSPTCSCSAGRRTSAARPATSTPRCSRTGWRPRANEADRDGLVNFYSGVRASRAARSRCGSYVDGADRTPAGKRERALVALLALSPGRPSRRHRGHRSVGRAGSHRRCARRAGRAGPGRQHGGGSRGGPGRPETGGRRRGRGRPRVRAPGARPAGQEPAQALDTVEHALACGVGLCCPGVEDVPFARRSSSG